MILNNPTMANDTTVRRMAKHTLQVPGDSQAYGKYIRYSTRSRNRRRLAGGLSFLISLCDSYSLSVGIVSSYDLGPLGDIKAWSILAMHPILRIFSYHYHRSLSCLRS